MLTKEQLQELEAKHQRIGRIADKDGKWECVFRKPTRTEYKRFRAMALDERLKPEAQEWLARVTVVHPSAEGFDALLEEYPALGDVAGDELSRLVGLTKDAMGKM